MATRTRTRTRAQIVAELESKRTAHAAETDPSKKAALWSDINRLEAELTDWIRDHVGPSPRRATTVRQVPSPRWQSDQHHLRFEADVHEQVRIEERRVHPHIWRTLIWCARALGFVFVGPLLLLGMIVLGVYFFRGIAAGASAQPTVIQQVTPPAPIPKSAWDLPQYQ